MIALDFKLVFLCLLLGKYDMLQTDVINFILIMIVAMYALWESAKNIPMKFFLGGG